MRPRPQYLAALLLLSLAHLAAAEPKPEVPKLPFPKLEGWALADPRPLPTESGGYIVSYNSDQPHIAVTIYVYNRGLNRIPSDLTGPDIQREFNTAKDSIHIAKQRGLYQEAKEEESKQSTLGPDKNAPKALYARFRLTIKEQQTFSEIYVLPHQNAFVKVRITRVSDDEKATQEKLARLYTALTKTLAP
jgi:hypothetical protein